jgi:hypothetical protein
VLFDLATGVIIIAVFAGGLTAYCASVAGAIVLTLSGPFTGGIEFEFCFFAGCVAIS